MTDTPDTRAEMTGAAILLACETTLNTLLTQLCALALAAGETVLEKDKPGLPQPKQGTPLSAMFGILMALKERLPMILECEGESAAALLFSSDTRFMMLLGGANAADKEAGNVVARKLLFEGLNVVNPQPQIVVPA
jgi:hypothetical protein